ncbi:MAG: hypothetical protein QOD56_2959, partial [Gammaproteobacteria bacterium]|nr:hypothetical protein [Gammaproteobacteria bacterium]
YISERAVFYLTAALTLPALFALLPLRRVAVAGEDLRPAPRNREDSRRKYLSVLADRRLLIFCACAMLFTFANAPLLMLVSGTLTAKGSNPSLLIAACIVLPQIIVAFASPSVGRVAERYGRRIVLMVGFGMLPLRCLLFTATQNPTLLVAVQALDGIAAACFGIMVPLIVSDVAGRTGHFNLSLGAVGFGIGIGGTLSTPAAGWLADHFGTRMAFYGLLAISLVAVLLVAFGMPETRPTEEEKNAANPESADPAPTGSMSEAMTPLTPERSSEAPSEAPSGVPSEAPSAVPSEAPSAVASEAPSAVPSEAPSAVPSEAPSEVPSEVPSGAPTEMTPEKANKAETVESKDGSSAEVPKPPTRRSA